MLAEHVAFNPLYETGVFLYPLKISESKNFWFSRFAYIIGCGKGVYKETSAMKWITIKAKAKYSS